MTFLAPVSADETETVDRAITFESKPVADLHTGTETLHCPTCEAVVVTGFGPRSYGMDDALRCHCGQWSVLPAVAGMRYNAAPLPSPLFRYIDTREHYLGLLSGNVWISTLTACRESEDKQRGDGRENLSHRRPSRPVTGSMDPYDVRMRKHMGVEIGGGQRFLMVEPTAVTEHPNQFVLCISSVLSVELADKFSLDGGRYGVSIRRLSALYDSIGRVLHKEHGLLRGEIGPVRYDAKEAVDDEPDQPIVWMRKPPRFAREREIRSVWCPKNSREIQPRLVHVANILDFIEPLVF